MSNRRPTFTVLQRLTGNLNDVIAGIIVGLPWLDLLTDFWNWSRNRWARAAREGMYEVLEYESLLDLRDSEGKHAQFLKREKVRYLQDNIIAYQDHAWGDGEILVDYQCKPGSVVDRYWPGHETVLLISLREVKSRGDEDEFHIEWGIKDGFIRSKEMWQTEIRHRTEKVKTQILFPESRPPKRVWVEENIRRKKHILSQDSIRQLPRGPWQVTWEVKNPRVNERYQLHWTW